MVLSQERFINLDLRRGKSRRSNKLEGGVADELSCKPKEWLLKVIIGFGRDVVVLQVLFAMESNGFRLDFTFFDVDLVSAENNWDIFANTDKITVPIGDVLVRNTRGNVEHDDAALAINVVTVTQAAKFLLTSSIPDLELDLTKVCEEAERMNLDTLSGNVFLLELASQMALDKGGLMEDTLATYRSVLE